MVLTNFECWALHDGATGGAVANFETRPSRAAAVDPFNPRAVSHISSNGYYGYAYVNGDTNNNHSDVALTDANDESSSAVRCKKRCFVDGGGGVDDADAGAGAMNSMIYFGDEPATAAKRCRYDCEGDGDLTAHYFNDFFSMPTTNVNQIGTQSCLMDCDMQLQSSDQPHPPQQAQQPPQIIQQQQPPTHSRGNQHYQGHLHRANRDTPNSNSPNKEMP